MDIVSFERRFVGLVRCSSQNLDSRAFMVMICTGYTREEQRSNKTLRDSGVLCNVGID